MDPNEIPPPESAALSCLERGGAVITANARAARSLRKLHAETQQRAGLQAWPTPVIHDLESWLGILWKQNLESVPDAPLLLSTLQERAVWKKIAGSPPTNSDAVAILAARAYKLLSDFDAHGELSLLWAGSVSRDVEAFRGWAASFERECRTNRWMPRADLADSLTKAIEAGNLVLPTEILLVGFDRITPAQQVLLDAAQAAGCRFGRQQAAEPRAVSQLVPARDLRDELETCAWWARRHIEENPSARIAVISQNLDASRGEIERTFRRVLMPGTTGIEANDAMPFEFSLGVPLASSPVVTAALLVLRWLAGPLEQDAISWLGMSGFLSAEGEDLAEMAGFDAEMRRHGQIPPEIHLKAFTKAQTSSRFKAAQGLLQRLHSLNGISADGGAGDRQRTYPEWVDLAEAFLTRAKWPGAIVLDSAEFQALARWERLTGEISALGFAGVRVTWSEFVTTLERYTKETVFAPESRDAPIQIMGALESSGQHFDAIWFLGADDCQWPPKGQPNPLLPLWLQRRAGMAHSSLEVDWALGVTMTRRLAGSAPDCVFSYAQRNDAGELRPSALLAEALSTPLEKVSSKELRASLNVAEQVAHRGAIEDCEDQSSVPWPIAINAGGSEVLKRQSACAFQSFATHRLGAKELDAAERGINARDRGTIVHDVMQAFWMNDNPVGLPLKTRANLKNAEVSGRLPEILDHHIAAVLRERCAGLQGRAWGDAYLQVEHERLRRLLLEWLKLEVAREDFTVEACESEGTAEINGLKLGVRVDRIDQVDDGRLILDYKTGEVSASMWDGARPDEPQLPLYGIYGPVENLRGLLFAQLRTGKMAFKGRAEDPTRTVSRSFGKGSSQEKVLLTETIRLEWTNALGDLAAQFVAGDAAVAPKDPPKTCKFCPLPGLCRIAESNIADDEDEDDEAELQEEEFFGD